jgi:hypothetical protein
VLTTTESGILGQGVALVSPSVSLSRLHVHFHCKTLLYRNLNQNCNILYSEPLIYSLHVCTCVFLLCQKSFDMILINNSSFFDGGVTGGIPCKILRRYLDGNKKQKTCLIEVVYTLAMLCCITETWNKQGNDCVG